MLFTPVNAHKVMAGRKTRTTRLSIPKWLCEGKIVAVQPGRGKKGIGHIEILKVTPQVFWDFIHWVYQTRDFAFREGKKDAGDFLTHLFQLSGKDKTWELINKNPVVYVIDFKVVKGK